MRGEAAAEERQQQDHIAVTYGIVDTWCCHADRTEDVADRRLLVNMSEEYALPQPLAEARKEQQSLRRELHTVNVGADCSMCACVE